jgi:hypothetical protein
MSERPELTHSFASAAAYATRTLCTLLALATALAGCATHRPSSSYLGQYPDPVTSPRWRAVLRSLGPSSSDGEVVAADARLSSTPVSPNAARLRGSAIVQRGDSSIETNVFVSVSGLRAGQPVAWRLQQGGCSGNGTMIGASSASRPMIANADGNAEGLAILSMPTPNAGSYAMVLLSRDTNSPIACGELMRAQ